MTDPNRTLIVGVLDRTGSMASIRSDTEGAWNTFIQTQREAELGDDVFVSLYQFDRVSYTEDILEIVYELKAIKDVPPLHLEPRGVTPLLDAVGTTITKVGGQLAKLDESQRPGKVYFVILTDGEENSSREYDLDTVKRLVTDHQDIWKWEFHFMGVGIDAFQVGGSMGVRQHTTYVAERSGDGVRRTYGASAQSIVTSRSKRD